MEEALRESCLLVLRIFQGAAFGVVCFQGRAVKVLLGVFVHRPSTFGAKRTVYVLCEQLPATFLVWCAVSALCRCLGRFGFLVVPGCCDFEHGPDPFLVDT